VRASCRSPLLRRSTTPRPRRRSEAVLATDRGRSSSSAKLASIDILSCPGCGGRMRLVALVTDPKSTQCSLRRLGEPTDAPVRGPPYWKSRVLRRVAGGDECTPLRSVVLHGLRPASWTASAPVRRVACGRRGKVTARRGRRRTDLHGPPKRGRIRARRRSTDHPSAGRAAVPFQGPASRPYLSGEQRASLAHASASGAELASVAAQQSWTHAGSRTHVETHAALHAASMRAPASVGGGAAAQQSLMQTESSKHSAAHAALHGDATTSITTS
jgi:hypothetical protein